MSLLDSTAGAGLGDAAVGEVGCVVVGAGVELGLGGKGWTIPAGEGEVGGGVGMTGVEFPVGLPIGGLVADVIVAGEVDGVLVVVEEGVADTGCVLTTGVEGCDEVGGEPVFADLAGEG